MNRMRDLRQKSDKELRDELVAIAGKVRAHRFGVAVQQQRDVRQRRHLRRTAARIRTLLTERTINA